MLTKMAQLWGLGSGWSVAAAILLVLLCAAFLYAGSRLAWIDAKTKLLPNRIVFPWAWTAGGLLLAACVCAGIAASQPGWVTYAPHSTQVFSPGGFSLPTPDSPGFAAAFAAQREDLAAPLWGVWGLRVLAGGAVSWLGYLLLRIIYPAGMGFGDVKLAGVLGMYLGYVGWWQVLLGALLAFVLGGVVSAALLVTRRAKRDSTIPFGPFMIAGAALAMVLPA
ncbi:MULTISPECIES: A24 family peptidase [Arthrobacter]|uniref:A24 family peptidase n=2 Tax=Arthrobacter TaxID=1663 RepID=A0ABU9KKF2_9MICC|nr:A24 family peptidase [Arthrobacter sp. YJM1]MDP5227378.1 A24 family peptidase [Arthrobacter sp. YJM1]